MEFDKRDEKMTQDIKTLKMLIESAENEGTEIINGVTYPASHTWQVSRQTPIFSCRFSRPTRMVWTLWR